MIVANKVNKIKKSKYEAQMQLVRETVGNHKVIPYSSETKVGIKELAREILN